MAIRGFEGDIVQNWAPGVMTTPPEDQLPDGALSYGKNSQFYHIGTGQTIVGTRQGCAVTSTDLATIDGKPVVSQWFLDTGDDAYHLCVNNTGDIRVLDATSGAFSELEAAVFADTDVEFSWASAKGSAFVANGTEQKRVTGTNVYAWGIAPISDTGWSIASAASSAPHFPNNYTYQLMLATKNAVTNVSSPVNTPKSVYVSSNGNGIQISITETAWNALDPQVDTIDVYILQNTVMTEFVKLQSIAKTAFTGTTTRTYIVHTDQNGLDALVVLAPLATDNYGPPTDGKFCKWLKSRMFVANADNVYWSQPGNPESFNLVNDYLPVDPDSGTPITGLGLINDYLIIFKSNGIYYLDGDSPQTYRIRLFDSTTGSLNHHSIINADNKLWFVANNGAHMWQGPGSPLTNISATMVKDEFDYVNVDYTDLYKLIGFEHPLQEYVAWVLVPANQTAGANQTIMIPFNYRTNTWMAHRWETIDVRSATVVPDTTNRQWPQLGDYSGTVYQLGTTANDGLHPLIDVDTATVSNIASITSVSQSTIENPDQEEITLGTGDPALADATAITVATKSWPVDVFVGRYMFVYDETTDYKDALRIKIIANSATVLYFEPFDMSTLRGTATVVIGGIQCDMKTPFRAGGSSFYKKRIEYVYTHTSDGSTGVVLDYYMYTNGNGDDYQRKKRVNFAFGSQYDFSQWNVGRFAAIGGEWRRVPFRKIGNNWQSRICHIGNNNRLLLHKLGVQWLTKTKKPGLGEA